MSTDPNAPTAAPPENPSHRSADEWLEVLDPSGEPTGERRLREVVHRQGLWHRTLHLWIVRMVSGTPYVLMQRRSGAKDLEPGKLDVAVGGHLGAGEGVAAGLREAEEELGLVLTPEDLVPLGCFRAERTYPHAVDREFQETFVLRRDAGLETYTLHPEEVAALYALPLEGAVALYERGTPLTAHGVDARGRRLRARLTAADLIEQARGEVGARLRQIETLLRGA